MTLKSFALAAALIAGTAAPMLAQEAEAQTTNDKIVLELNDATDLDDGACRLVYVVENGTQTAIDNATYEVAMFNDRNVVSKMLLLEFGGLGAGKTRVVQFDVPGQTCGEISKILVNNQVDCATADGDSTMCTAALATRALDTDIVFTH